MRPCAARWKSAGIGSMLAEPRTPLMGWAQVIRREPGGDYLGGADPRADSLAGAA